jgi:hypothetical protein
LIRLPLPNFPGEGEFVRRQRNAGDDLWGFRSKEKVWIGVVFSREKSIKHGLTLNRAENPRIMLLFIER